MRSPTQKPLLLSVPGSGKPVWKHRSRHTRSPVHIRRPQVCFSTHLHLWSISPRLEEERRSSLWKLPLSPPSCPHCQNLRFLFPLTDFCLSLFLYLILLPESESLSVSASLSCSLFFGLCTFTGSLCCLVLATSAKYSRSVRKTA